MVFLIIKYNEISLKGSNKIYFEEKIIHNIRDCFKKNKIKTKKINKTHNRLIIKTPKNPNLERIFGTSYICEAIKTKLDLEEIKKTTLKLSKKITHKKTFKISTKRGNKNFPYTSMDVNKIVGAVIAKKTKAKVDLSNPDIEVFIDILNNALIYTKRIKGPGGLPIGSEGKVLSLIGGEASILASLLAMKRGCSIIPIYFKKTNMSLLKKYAYGFELKPIQIKNIKETDKIAKQKKAKALVVSQTLDNIKDLPIKTPILRPLIALTNEQTKEKLASF